MSCATIPARLSWVSKAMPSPPQGPSPHIAPGGFGPCLVSSRLWVSPDSITVTPFFKSVSLLHPAATAHPERCGPSRLQPSKVFTRHTPAMVTPLAVIRFQDPIQNSVSGLHCSQQDGHSLPTGHHSGLHTSLTTPLSCHRLLCPSCQPCN